MSFLLDTDICSAYIKGNQRVWQKVMQHGGQLHVSVISVAELFTWASRKHASPKRQEAIEEFLASTTLLEVNYSIGLRFGELRAALLDAGQGTPEMDLLIAATALVHDLTLVTHNVQDFTNLPGLKIQDWIT